MENARIAIFDDNANFRLVLRVRLEMLEEHKIVTEVDSLEDAEKVIEDLQPNSIDVALVDSDLGSHTPNDGQEIVRMLREREKEIGKITIIGISSLYELPEADQEFPKGNYEAMEAYIRRL